MHFRWRYCSLPCLFQARLGDIRDVGCNCERQTQGEKNTFQRRAGDVDPFVWEDFPPKVMVVIKCVSVCSLLALSFVFPLMPNTFC